MKPYEVKILERIRKKRPKEDPHKIVAQALAQKKIEVNVALDHHGNEIWDERLIDDLVDTYIKYSDRYTGARRK